MQIRQETIDFLTLKITPEQYEEAFTADPSIIDELYTMLPKSRDIKSPEWKDISSAYALQYHNFDLVKYLTGFGGMKNLYGKSSAYTMVYDIVSRYTDIPKNTYYHDAFIFIEDTLPEYIGGEEVEPLFYRIYTALPENLPEKKKKRIYRKEVMKHFHRKTLFRPMWPQSAEWPAGKSGEPMIYLSVKSDGDLFLFRFQDADTGEIREVETYM